MRRQRAPPTVHQHIGRTGSYERAECLERRPIVSRDRAEPCRAPSFASHGPPVTSAYGLSRHASRPACSRDENVVENWSLRLTQERDRHAGRPSCNGHGLNPPRTLPVSRPVIHAHHGEHQPSSSVWLSRPADAQHRRLEHRLGLRAGGGHPQDQYRLPCAWERQERPASVRFVRMNYFGPTTHTTSPRRGAPAIVALWRGGSAFGLALSRRPPGARTRLLRTSRSHESLPLPPRGQVAFSPSLAQRPLPRRRRPVRRSNPRHVTLLVTLLTAVLRVRHTRTTSQTAGAPKTPRVQKGATPEVRPPQGR